MSATHSWLMSLATSLAFDQVRCGALAFALLGGDAPATPAADTLNAVVMHQTGNALFAGVHTAVSQLGTHARHTVGLIACAVGRTDVLQQHLVGTCTRTGGAIQPVVIAAGAHLEVLAQSAHR